MPSSNKTTNYELNKWAGNEYPKRSDFVEDNEKIDAALTPIADPSLVPSGNGPGKLSQWVSWFANRLKAITGKPNWWDAPDTTLASAKNHIDASAPHSGHETPSGAQDKANAALSAAKDYADGVGSSAVAAANSYTDQEVGEVAGVLAEHKAESASLTKEGHVRLSNDIDNSEALAATPKAVKALSDSISTKSEINYYVDSINGNDNNDGNTLENAFKSIQKALNKIPPIINHSVMIRVSPGTYPEDIIINGFTGKGTLTLQGATSVATTHKVNSIHISNSQINVLVRGFDIQTTTRAGVEILNCIAVEVRHFNNISSAPSHTGIMVKKSNCKVESSVVSNKLIAIDANEFATIYSNYNTGDNNSTGLRSQVVSIIGKNGPQPSGSISEEERLGGVIRQ